MPRTGVRRAVVGALLAVVLLVVPMACSDSSTPAAGEPTADCAASSALKSSLDTLTKVEPLQDGLTALNAAVADVKTSLNTAAASASDALRPAVDGVKTAFSELETAASGLTADNLRQKGPAISSALRQVGTAATSLGTALKESCPAR
ncbi:hypothetical protein EV645_6401 [Kribbella rubisoli]|uniref:Uncharacterized protein n=1 Tax=Kribbella rubisoli TaxID=3075929 RepID=A0A4Q7WMD7_9ACTN|nr:hypothetical protein [Kribbella rubisoli]RZU11241.1 hypothetical protein EV645_6401 [Kribbella rubisoli]